VWSAADDTFAADDDHRAVARGESTLVVTRGGARDSTRATRGQNVFTTKLAWSVCLASALAAGAASGPGGALPFETLGKALTSAADAAQAKDAPAPKDLLERLEPLHDCIRLGAFELWLPRKVVKLDASVTDASPSDQTRDFAVALVKLQREWLERVGIGGEDLASDRAALDDFLRFATRVRRSPFPAPDAEALASRKLIETAFFGVAQADHTHRSVLILAPTRAQFVAVLGAAGSMSAIQRSFFWSDEAGHSGSVALAPGRLLVALSIEAAPAADSLRDEALAPEVRLQTIVHSASHMLSTQFVPTAPKWFNEGLAIVDTIATVRADETLCTGYPTTAASSGFSLGGDMEGVFFWAARQASPYREGASAHYFTDELRGAHVRDGFKIVNLEDIRASLPLSIPMLTEGYEMPKSIAVAPPGFKKGFAEFFRAYCAGFVHWLDLDQATRPRVLNRLVSELHHLPPPGKEKPGPLYKCAHSLCGRTIGEALDPETDLEAGFFVYLAR
jgi:hypothetical protein